MKRFPGTIIPVFVLFLIFSLGLCLTAPRPAFADAPTVTAREDAAQIVMDNGTVALTLAKKGAAIVSVKYRHDDQVTETCQAMYFDLNGGAKVVPAGMTAPRAGYEPLGAYVQSVRLARNTPELAEAVLTGGPTPLLPFVTEIHYVLPRGASGFYAFCRYRHAAGMAAGGVGQTRFVFRGPPGPSLFTHHIVDDARQGPFPLSPTVRTVSDATFLLADGSVYTKYDNTAFIAEHFVHGMAGHGVGVWMINPSSEYVNGGPVKQELTVHADNTLLNMLQGGHFGGGGLDFADNEPWIKFYGPFLVYLNSGPSVKALYADAKNQAARQKAQWPYGWVKDAAYPLQRATVTGTLRLRNGKSAADAWVGLAAPGGDWPLQGKGYQFWTRAGGDGRFSLPKVRPGTYTLYAYGANQFEQFQRDGITAEAGRTQNLETLDWKPVTRGRTLWQIGTADRSTREFRNGGDVRHWANFLRYPKDFPDDVTFVIGKSRERADWNFAQWTWYCRKPHWTIRFDLPRAQRGQATLTLGIAASNPVRGSHTNLQVKVNGQEVSVVHLGKSGAAAYRSGGQDSTYAVQYSTFDAGLLKMGVNEITLGDLDAKPFPSEDEQRRGAVGAVMYDAIRLEVNSKP